MSDPTVLLALLLTGAALDASPIVRLPVGLVAATGALSQGMPLLPCALAGTVGIALGRGWLALASRRALGGDRDASPLLQVQRVALEHQLRTSANPGRIAFTVAAAPGVPRQLLFPVLGRGAGPVLPALVGTVFGKLPIVLLSTAFFALVAFAASGGEREQGAIVLGVVAGFLLVVRSIRAVDWQRHRTTGEWRMREDAATPRSMTWFGGPFGAGTGDESPARAHDPNDDVIEGEVLGEEVDDDARPAQTRGSLPFERSSEESPGS